MILSILIGLIFILVITWILYPLVAVLYSRNSRVENIIHSDCYPYVSIIVPVFNGSNSILNKYNNLLSLHYPHDKLEIIFINDCSSDNSLGILNGIDDPRVRVHSLEHNSGKSAAQNLGVSLSAYRIILFTDVESLLDTDFLLNSVPLITDNTTCVGARLIYSASNSPYSKTYAKYGDLEHSIRVLESSFSGLLSVQGSAFLIDKSAYKKLDLDTGDDFVIPMDMALNKFKTVYSSSAVVYDSWPSVSPLKEFKVRNRIVSRNLLALSRRFSLLNPFAFPAYSFSIIFHKLSRWLTLYLLILLFILSHFDSSYFSFILRYFEYAYLASLLFSLILYRTGNKYIRSFLIFNIMLVGMAFGVFNFLRRKKIYSYTN